MIWGASVAGTPSASKGTLAPSPKVSHVQVLPSPGSDALHQGMQYLWGQADGCPSVVLRTACLSGTTIADGIEEILQAPSAVVRLGEAPAH